MTIAPLAPVPALQLDVIGEGKRLLTAVENGLTAQGCELPSRVGMTPGSQLAFDGDQLTVTFQRITIGMPSKPVIQGVNPASVTYFYEYEVNLLRKVSVLSAGGAPPPPDTLTGEYAMLGADVQQLLATLANIHGAGVMVPPAVPLIYGPLQSLGPEGGLAGIRVPVAWQAMGVSDQIVVQPG